MNKWNFIDDLDIYDDCDNVLSQIRRLDINDNDFIDDSDNVPEQMQVTRDEIKFVVCSIHTRH